MVTVALLLTTPQSAVVVVALTWIGPTLAPPATVPRSQLSTWAPTAPVIAQPANAGSSDQFRSAPAGRLSVTWTPVAGTEPVFVTVMSKPMTSPASTGPGGFDDFETSTIAPTIVAFSLPSEHCPVTASLSVSPG